MTHPVLDVEHLISISQPTGRPNFTRVRLPGLTVWFSYQTPVAFAVGEGEWRVTATRNLWGPTTGKHLNEIDGGSKEAQAARLPWDEFAAAYRAAVSAAFLMLAE
jgi:hypothetical protein